MNNRIILVIAILSAFRLAAPPGKEDDLLNALSLYQSYSADPKGTQRYALPGEIIVDMNDANSITVAQDGHKKTISTSALVYCTALAIYARQGETQKLYLSHDDPMGILKKLRQRVFNAIDDMRAVKFKPDIIKAFIIVPKVNLQPGTWHYDEYSKLDKDILPLLSHEFSQGHVSIEFSPYAFPQTIVRKPFKEGGRDIIVELDPDYTKSSFLPKDSDIKVLFNK